MGASAIETIERILSDNPKKSIVDPSLVPAGVMLLLYPKDGEYCILLNKRTDRVEHHKGEISFPGGSKDPEDGTCLDAALRETEEEMGIRLGDVKLLGELDDMPTNSGFVISTYVGTIPYPYDFQPSEIEVAQVLEVPIGALMGDDGYRDEVRIIEGELTSSPSYAYEGHLVYGATARVIHRFLELVGTAGDEESLWQANS